MRPIQDRKPVLYSESEQARNPPILSEPSSARKPDGRSEIRKWQDTIVPKRDQMGAVAQGPRVKPVK